MIKSKLSLPVIILLSFIPFLWLLTDLQSGEGWLFVIANVTGFIGAVILWWQFALGVRPISRLFSVDYSSLIKIHIWLGTYGFLFIILHGVLEMFEYSSGLAFLFIPAFKNEFFIHLSLGQFALWMFLAIWITSAILRKSIAYRPWKYIHYLSYPAGFFVYIHAFQIGTYLNSFLWLSILWYVMAFSYVVMVLYRLLESSGLVQSKYRLESITKHTEKITTYRFIPSGSRNIHPEIGQFVYLTLRPFGESHPFSVMDFDSETGLITLGIKQFGRFTKKLMDLKPDQKVFLSKPYGIFTREAYNSKPKVLIAGGIGITPFVSLVKKYPQNTYLLNCNTDIENAILRDVFRQQLDERYVDIVSPERISVSTFQKLPEKYLKESQFFICGPVGLIHAVKDQLATLGISQDRIFTEEFSF